MGKGDDGVERRGRREGIGGGKRRVEGGQEEKDVDWCKFKNVF